MEKRLIKKTGASLIIPDLQGLGKGTVIKGNRICRIGRIAADRIRYPKNEAFLGPISGQDEERKLIFIPPSLWRRFGFDSRAGS